MGKRRGSREQLADHGQCPWCGKRYSTTKGLDKHLKVCDQRPNWAG